MLIVRLPLCVLFALGTLCLSIAPTKTAKADFIDLDTTQVAPQFVALFQQAEAFWEARVLGYSNTIPNLVRRQMTGRLTIIAGTADLPPPILGQAGPLPQSTIFRVATTGFRAREPMAIPTVAVMQFDNNFLATSTDQDRLDVIIHEMGHAIGVGALWVENNLYGIVNAGPFGAPIDMPRPTNNQELTQLVQFSIGAGPDVQVQYLGINGRTAYGRELGLPFTPPFVPVERNEQFAPPISLPGGSTYSHWADDDPFFNTIATNNRIELMTQALVPDTQRFISQTTLGSLVDMHYVVAGFNESELLPASAFTSTPIPGAFPKVDGALFRGAAGQGGPAGLQSIRSGNGRNSRSTGNRLPRRSPFGIPSPGRRGPFNK